jgi:putative tricarboxylic transport membrane protein
MNLARFLLRLAACSVVLAPASGAEPGWKPERAVEVVVSAGPGGNQDLTARILQKIWNDRRIVENVVVMNKPGGGGNLAFNYVSQHAGDPHYLLMLAPTMFTNRITGVSAFNYTDFTPIALLFNEYVFVSVRADSPIERGQDLIRRLKADPAAMSVAIATALGNHIHMGIAMPMKAAGVDVKRMKIVTFKSSGESITALLGGHVDVAASTFGTVLPYLQSKKLRVLGVSAPQRISGELAAIPTWKEQGADAVYDAWRGLVAAKGIGEAQLAYWEAAVAELVRTDEWKQDVQKNHRVAAYLNGKAAAQYWREQYAELEGILNELGLARRSAAR